MKTLKKILDSIIINVTICLFMMYIVLGVIVIHFFALTFGMLISNFFKKNKYNGIIHRKKRTIKKRSRRI